MCLVVVSTVPWPSRLLTQVVDKLVRLRLIGFREEHLLHQLVADEDAALVLRFREVSRQTVKIRCRIPIAFVRVCSTNKPSSSTFSSRCWSQMGDLFSPLLTAFRSWSQKGIKPPSEGASARSGRAIALSPAPSDEA